LAVNILGGIHNVDNQNVDTRNVDTKRYTLQNVDRYETSTGTNGRQFKT